MSKNYSFVSRGDDNWTSIMISKGPYEGIIYQYGKVSVSDEEDENGYGKLSFQYNVLDEVDHNLKDQGLQLCAHASPNRDLFFFAQSNKYLWQ